jgi:hypothetical protein
LSRVFGGGCDNVSAPVSPTDDRCFAELKLWLVVPRQ